jgi:hypothetical protein
MTKTSDNFIPYSTEWLSECRMDSSLAWNTLQQGCANTRLQITKASKFYAEAPNSCGSSVRNSIHVILLALRILTWFLHVWQFVGPCSTRFYTFLRVSGVSCIHTAVMNTLSAAELYFSLWGFLIKNISTIKNLASLTTLLSHFDVRISFSIKWLKFPVSIHRSFHTSSYTPITRNEHELLLSILKI